MILDAINVCLAKVNKTHLILSPEEIVIAVEIKDLLGIFESSLRVLQSSSEPTTNLVILFNHIIKSK